MRKSLLLLVGAMLAIGTVNQTNAQVRVRVDVINNAPAGGDALTPLWVGFHNGSFDSFDFGSSVALGLEQVAEDGTTGLISENFADNVSYVTTGVTQTGTRVQGTLASPTGPPPIQSGESVSQFFDLSVDGSNRYFSYASMVLPSSDFFVANEGSTDIDLLTLISGGGEIEFQIGTVGSVHEAGTEVNDFATAPGNPLFGIDVGQTANGQGADENGVVTTVGPGNPFANFLNQDLANGADLANGPLNFNNYTNGIATVRITAVAIPEPSSLALIALSIGGIAARRRKSAIC